MVSIEIAGGLFVQFVQAALSQAQTPQLLLHLGCFVDGSNPFISNFL